MQPRYLTLIVKPTHRCNLHCPYCYDFKFKQNIKQYLTLDDIRKTLKIFDGRILNWIWHGGEPFMMGVDYLDEQGEIIKKYDPDIQVSIQTNLTLIKDKEVEYLKKYNITPGTSYDGLINPETRKNDKEFFYSMNLCKSNDIHPGAIMVITNKNIDNLILEYENMKQKKITGQMNLVFEQDDNDFSEEIQQDNVYQGWKKLFYYWIYDVNNPIKQELITWYIEQLTGNPHMCEQNDCAGKWFSIHPDGNIYPCGRDWDDNMLFGNIHDIETVDEIYYNEKFKNFYYGTRGLLNKCKDCIFFNGCHSGCYATSYHYDRSLSKVDQNTCKLNRLIYNFLSKFFYEFDYKSLSDPKILQGYNPFFIKLILNLGLRGKQIIDEQTIMAKE